MSKLWGGRFSSESLDILDKFNSSIEFDKILYRHDIEGSVAHIKMLSKQNIISKNEEASIVEALKKIEKEIEVGDLNLDIEQEDIHTAIENRLTVLLGDLGKKLHTARSRNDQVALDLKLYSKDSIIKIKKLLLNIIGSIIDISDKHVDTLFAGRTHLQHAQVISFGYHMLAYASMFKRDFDRFDSSYKRNNLSPLGSCALAGTSYNIDRDLTAHTLGFDAPTLNALDSVSDRDFELEILFNISVLMMHISRLCEELIMWSSYEFNFVKFSNSYSTGSSIMPQKINPDVAELLRAKTGRVNGNLISLLTVLKGLPLAYNKDMQEDKESLFDSVNTALISLEIFKESICTLKIDKKNMLASCKMGHMNATDLADYLVKNKGIAFRDAYKISAKAVMRAVELKKNLSDLTLEELKSIDTIIDKPAMKVLSLETSLNSKNSQGGTSQESTKKQIEYFREWILDNS